VKEKNFRAFERYALHNEPVEQVAAELGISTNTVYIAKNRVARMLEDEVGIGLLVFKVGRG